MDQETENEVNLPRTAKQNSRTADEMQKARGVIKQNKKYNNQLVREQARIHLSRKRGRRGRRRRRGGAKKNNAEERSAARSPVSFSLEQEAEEPRPLPLLSLRDVRKIRVQGGKQEVEWK